MLRYTPCNILGFASLHKAAPAKQQAGGGEAGGKGERDKGKKGVGGAAGMTIVIDTERKWRAAVKEVEEDWAAYR